MPFCHQLSTNDDLTLTGRNALDLPLHCARGTEHIRGKCHHIHLREQRLCLFGKPFNPRTDNSHTVRFPAGRTGLRDRPAIATLMTHQTFLKPVFHEACIAVLASNLLTAGATQGNRRIAAPIKKQKRLFSFCDPLSDCIL